jgi:hypothetical protein
MEDQKIKLEGPARNYYFEREKETLTFQLPFLG